MTIILGDTGQQWITIACSLHDRELRISGHAWVKKPNQTKPNQPYSPQTKNPQIAETKLKIESGNFLPVASEYRVFSSTLRTLQERNNFLPSSLSSWLFITTTEQRGTGLQNKKGKKISFYQIYVTLRGDQVHDRGWNFWHLGISRYWLS